MKWLKFTVITTTEGSELVSSVLCDFGSEGTCIDDYNDVLNLIKSGKNWDYIDDELLKARDERVYVSGFFAEDYDTEQLNGALDALKNNTDIMLGSMETRRTIIDSEDWENEWRKYYAPIIIGKSIIVPAWMKDTDLNGHIPVYIEPGMAFGTGNHETTSMCIELMQDVNVLDMAVADVGCGSGILGVTALTLGAKECVFNDIDPLAVKATEENIKLNNFENYKLICGDMDVGDQKFDIVLANLTADLLLCLKKKLSSLCHIGSKIIISGIINARAEEILAAYSNNKLVKACKKGEWQAMMFEVV